MQDRTSLFIFPALLLIFLAGCAAQPTTLMLQPLSRRVIYAQKFGQAYAGQDDDSSPAFLLVSDDAAATSSKHGAQLQPADARDQEPDQQGSDQRIGGPDERAITAHVEEAVQPVAHARPCR